MKSAIAVPIENDNAFYHIYDVKLQYCFCCYKPFFSVRKQNNCWLIKKENVDNFYSIPAEKTKKEIINILMNLGFKNKILKVCLKQNGEILKEKVFFNIKNLFSYIFDIENTLLGVYYYNS